MPTYEYECTECRHRFEVFQSMKDEPIKECVKCGKSVRKLINGGAGIIFKGSGFYKNDYSSGVTARGQRDDLKSRSVEEVTNSTGGGCSSCPMGESCPA
jgi:putative FmdB family regulatory protein